MINMKKKLKIGPRYLINPVSGIASIEVDIVNRVDLAHPYHNLNLESLSQPREVIR